MKIKVICKEVKDHIDLVYEKCRPTGHVSDYLDYVYENYPIELPVDVPKKYETAVQNFLRETRFIILVANDGATKTLFLVKEVFDE